MKVFLGTDHAGFAMKEKIKQWLGEWGCEYEDMGAFVREESDDYPDFVIPVACKVAEDAENFRGIVLGGSGQGEAIVANRQRGVRAAVYSARILDIELAKLMREHNNANVLSIGTRFVPEDDA